MSKRYGLERFIKDNNGLIFEFMKQRRLKERKYFDLLLPAYEEAAAKYYNDPNLQDEFDLKEFVDATLLVVLAERNRKKLSSPNEVVISSFGGVLFHMGTPYAFDGTGSAEDPAEQIARRDLVDSIFKLITDKEKDVLMMRVDRDCSIEEIAEQCGITPNCVRSRFYRMRNRIMTTLTVSELF